MNAISLSLESPRWDEFNELIGEAIDPLWDPESVSNYPTFEYDKDDVIWAGKGLLSDVSFKTEEDKNQALRLFEIANSWRDSHLYPMNKLRAEVRGHLQRLRLQSSAITVARLKRMLSIRKKLRRRPENLSQEAYPVDSGGAICSV